MKSQPVRFINRYTKAVETEPVPGEGWLRWLYETRTGPLALHTVVKRAFLSRWYGGRLNTPASRAKIAPFVKQYGLDPAEFSRPMESYSSFNDFFYRELADGTRPIDPDPAALVFPADGRHHAFPNIDQAEGFFVKGQKFTVAELLGDAGSADQFLGGAMVISRLCPTDYHRYHFSCAGVAGLPKLINGPLFSVNPIALRQNVGFLVQNKRTVTLLKSTHFGTVAILEIGATMVGGIVQTFEPGKVRKGGEKGYFEFGGSCVITLLERGRVVLADDVVKNSCDGMETYARMGDRLGIALAH